ncbi:MAG: hypothetical protein ACOX0A_00055 [Thermoguttaceae bacterium]|jgi:hypothetical protein
MNSPYAVVAACCAILALISAIVFHAASSLVKNNRAAWILVVAVAAAFLGIAQWGAAESHRQQRDAAEKKARQELVEMIEELRLAFEENDYERAEEFISENAPRTLAILENNRNAIKIRKIELEELQVDELTLDEKPPRATLSFQCVATGTADVWPTMLRLPYKVELEVESVELRREQDGKWRVQDRYSVKTTSI